jgi:drug/metabolite transporter (DMT)-like permease
VSIEALAFIAAIASGFLHAVWNAMAQRSSDPSGAMVSQLAFAGLGASILCVFVGWPDSRVWHWMVLGAVSNAVAIMLLSAGYKRGNYAVTYGISRATVPWVLMPLSVFVAGSAFSPWGVAGVAAISVGVFLAATRGAELSAETKAASAFAVASGLCMAFSIFSDSSGVRGSSMLEYGAAQTVLNAAVGSLVFSLQQQRSLTALMRRNWRVAMGSALISMLPYVLILWVFTTLPAVVGAALRDSSMLFALLIGTFIFRERLKLMQCVGCALFVVGVLMLRM